MEEELTWRVALLTLYTHGNWPIWIGLILMFLTDEIGKCITFIEIEREQFGDDGTITRPKVRTQQFTRHKTESKHFTDDFMCILHLLYFSAAFVDNKI